MQKRYTINWEGDEVLSVEVDGVRYEDAGQIPDPEDRARMQRIVSSLSGMPVAQPFVVSRLIVPLFFAVAVLMLSICAFTAVNTSRALAREASVQGYVVDVVARALAHRLDHLLPALHAQAHPLLLRAGGRGDRGVQVVEDARALVDDRRRARAARS